jgi:hypothetical protein
MRGILVTGVALLALGGVAMAQTATPKQQDDFQAAIHNPPPYPDLDVNSANGKETDRICGLVSPLGKPTSVTATGLTHNEMTLCMRAAMDRDVARASLPVDSKEGAQIIQLKAQLAAAEDQIHKLQQYIAMPPSQPLQAPTRMHCEPSILGHPSAGMDCRQQ